MDNITEIRIEEVRDYDNNEFCYYIYGVKDTGERIEIEIQKNLNVIDKLQYIINQSLDFKNIDLK